MFSATAIEGVLVATPRRFEDDRGYFSETFRESWLADAGVKVSFVQDNQAFSRDAGTLRGLHYQVGASAQGKLVRVSRGSILDVAVDIRPGPTFGHHVAVELSGANGKMIWVPPGFAHGYVTLEPETEVLYKTTSYYDPHSEGGILYNDPDLGIAWPEFPNGLILSPKDTRWPRLRQSGLPSNAEG